MSNTAIVVALLVGIAVWFAVASRLTAKPWENRGEEGDVGAIRFSPARIGLWVFMAVVTSLFALFLTAYSMRMHHSVGWCHLTMPRIAWLNTLVLVAASVAHAVRLDLRSPRGRRQFAQVALVAGRRAVDRVPRRAGGSPGRRSARRSTTCRAAPRSRSSTC